MKKLMIAACAVALAAAAQAASYSWSELGDGLAQAGTTDYIADSTAYLFNSGAVSAQSVIDYFVANGTIASGSISTGTMTSGGVSPVNFTYDVSPATTLTAFYAVIDSANKNIFISEMQTVAQQATSTMPIDFTDPWDRSVEAAFAAGSEYSTAGSGWYAAAPEPTSGLLLLLGMGALALRRRRA